MNMSSTASGPWLFFLFNLPGTRASERVKVWRRLKKFGAFHLVPRLERTTRERALPGKSSSFVRQRGILGEYFIVILHLGTVHKTESRNAFSVPCAYSFSEPSAACAPTANAASR